MSAAQLFLPASRAFNSNGLPVAGAVLKLYTTGTLIPQPFYSDGALSVSLGSSVTANAAGRFQTVYQDNATAFRLRIEDATGAELDDIDPYYFGTMLLATVSNAITPQLYGAKADDVTDDSAAFVAAIAAANALATTGYGFGKGAPRVFVPAGKYYLGTTTLDLTYSMIFEGESTGGPTGPASLLRWADNTTGIRVQNFDTSGATGPGVVTSYPGGQMATIRNLSLRGGFVATESESHGVHLRCKAVLRDLYIEGFGGDGVHATVAATDLTYEGNANDAIIENVFVLRCRNGMRIEGLDTNAIQIIQPNCNSNRAWGIYTSNIGLNVFGGDMSSNGQIAGFPTMISVGGYIYACIAGQETWCSTHTASGTTATNQGWLYVGAGGVTAARPAFSSGTAYRAGGPIFITGNSNYNVIAGIYAESDQGPAQIDNCFTLWLSPLGGIPVLNSGGTCDGSPYGGQLVGNSSNVRAPRSLCSGDTTVRGQMSFTEGIDELWRYKPRDGSAQLYSVYGGGTMAVNDSSSHQYYYYDLATGRIGNLTLLTALKIDGLQVLGVRNTGWTADTGTAEKTAHATYTAGTTLTYSVGYDQTEQTAMATRMALVEAALQNVTRGQKALKDMVIGHGFAGA